MWHNLFVKITGFVIGIVSLFFPFGNPGETVYQASTTSTKITIQATTSTESTHPSVQASTTPKTITTTPKKPTTAKPLVVATTTIATAPVQMQKQTVPFEQINADARAALINILCTTQTGGPFSSISGSGVMISSDGVILTNAHIGQYFLLTDFNGQKDFVQCIIRTGSPAYPAYKAELVYISPTWIKDNSKVLTESNPTGTGEHDYAFLKVISKVDGSPISYPLPHLAISLNENLSVGDNILLASYPAGFLGGITIEKDLFLTSAISQISHVFTFATYSTDVISVPGTVVSQKGSSGGAAINDQDRLVGIITTSSDADTTSTRDLRAITLAYINRDLTASASIDLQTILSNSDDVATTFNTTIAGTLSKILTDSILSN